MARREVITPAEFPDGLKELDGAMKDAELGLKPGRSLREVEREMVIRTLEETGGNRTQTARLLGISRRTLQLKLKEYGIN
jgi:two-component system, NtrC family, response regulator HydG